MHKLFTLLLTIIAVNVYSQDVKFSFSDKTEDFMAEDIAVFGNEHSFGPNFTLAFMVLESMYTTTPDASPTNPNPSKEILKPSIYNNVRKMDRAFKKQVKKGVLEAPQAREKLMRVLAVAYSIYYEDTIELEAMLWKIKDAAALESLFLDEIELI